MVETTGNQWLICVKDCERPPARRAGQGAANQIAMRSLIRFKNARARFGIRPNRAFVMSIRKRNLWVSKNRVKGSWSNVNKVDK